MPRRLLSLQLLILLPLPRKSSIIRKILLQDLVQEEEFATVPEGRIVAKVVQRSTIGSCTLLVDQSRRLKRMKMEKVSQQKEVKLETLIREVRMEAIRSTDRTDRVQMVEVR
jgi:hypothetical protein